MRIKGAVEAGGLFFLSGFFDLLFDLLLSDGFDLLLGSEKIFFVMVDGGDGGDCSLGMNVRMRTLG